MNNTVLVLTFGLVLFGSSFASAKSSTINSESCQQKVIEFENSINASFQKEEFKDDVLESSRELKTFIASLVKRPKNDETVKKLLEYGVLAQDKARGGSKETVAMLNGVANILLMQEKDVFNIQCPEGYESKYLAPKLDTKTLWKNFNEMEEVEVNCVLKSQFANDMSRKVKVEPESYQRFVLDPKGYNGFAQIGVCTYFPSFEVEKQLTVKDESGRDTLVNFTAKVDQVCYVRNLHDLKEGKAKLRLWNRQVNGVAKEIKEIAQETLPECRGSTTAQATTYQDTTARPAATSPVVRMR